MLSMALEDHADSHKDADINVPAAAQWIIHAGEVIFRLCSDRRVLGKGKPPVLGPLITVKGSNRLLTKSRRAMSGLGSWVSIWSDGASGKGDLSQLQMTRADVLIRSQLQRLRHGL